MSWSRVCRFLKREVPTEELDLEAQKPLLQADDDELLVDENLEDDLPENNKVIDLAVQDQLELKHIRAQLKAVRLLKEQLTISVRHSKVRRNATINTTLAASFGGGLCMIGTGAAGVMYDFLYRPALKKLNYLIASASGQELQALMTQFVETNYNVVCNFIRKAGSTNLDPAQVFPHFLHLNTVTLHSVPLCNQEEAWRPAHGVNCSAAVFEYIANLQHQICELNRKTGYSNANNEAALYDLAVKATGAVIDLTGIFLVVGAFVLLPMILSSYNDTFDSITAEMKLVVKGDEIKLLKQLNEESGFNQLFSGLYHDEWAEGEDGFFRLLLIPLMADLEEYEAALKSQEEKPIALIEYQSERRAFLAGLSRYNHYNDKEGVVLATMTRAQCPDSIVATIFKYAGWLSPGTRDYAKRIEIKYPKNEQNQHPVTRLAL